MKYLQSKRNVNQQYNIHKHILYLCVSSLLIKGYLLYKIILHITSFHQSFLLITRSNEFNNHLEYHSHVRNIRKLSGMCF